jgi:hypothetical protein
VSGLPRLLRGVLAALLVAMAATGAPALAQAPPSSISGPEISALIRSTLVALDQANLTGNYTVLRDLGGPRFRSTYSPADLSDMFREFRQRSIVLDSVVLHDARLDEPARLTTDGLLRLVGRFPTEPQIIFEMTFFFENGWWRLEELNVGQRPAEQVTTPAAGN